MEHFYSDRLLYVDSPRRAVQNSCSETVTVIKQHEETKHNSFKQT